jgi:iron(III) transport system ATP-binding protein
VALARALVLNPDILLLDEPLSNLDAKIRVHVRGEIRKLQKELGITTIYVTHDQEEALSLSDRVAVMRDGKILQVAPPKTLYERPVNRFVADFVGTNNFISGVCRERSAERTGVETPLGRLAGRPAESVEIGARCGLAVRAVHLARGGDGENGVEGRVSLAAYLGHPLRYDVETAAGLVLKVDVRDPWNHDPLPTGHAVRLTCPASVALTLPDC